MQGATAIAKILKIEGVDFISGFPMNAVFEAGAKEGTRPTMSRNERVGVGIADGSARASFAQGIQYSKSSLSALIVQRLSKNE